MTTPILEMANHPSSLIRQKAILEFASLKSEEQQTLFVELIQSPYKDLREGILDVLSAEVLQSNASWLNVIAKHLPENPATTTLLSIGLLSLLARFENVPDNPCLRFAEKCLRTDNSDLQYQAIVFLELQNDGNPAYLEALPPLLEAADEEVRIIAIQAIARLAPHWGASKLTTHATHARGIEGFHTLLARLTLGDEATHRTLEPDLIRSLYQDRFCYPAILALKQYGSERCIEDLLRIAGSFFGEPTMRIAAADAAAKLGSDEGLRWLRKFAQKSGNTDYAKQMLSAYAEK